MDPSTSTIFAIIAALLSTAFIIWIPLKNTTKTVPEEIEMTDADLTEEFQNAINEAKLMIDKYDNTHDTLHPKILVIRNQEQDNLEAELDALIETEDDTEVEDDDPEIRALMEELDSLEHLGGSSFVPAAMNYFLPIVLGGSMAFLVRRRQLTPVEEQIKAQEGNSPPSLNEIINKNLELIRKNYILAIRYKHLMNIP